MHFSAEFGDPDISALVDSNIIRPDVLRQDLVGSRADFRHLDPSSGHPHTLQKMSHEGWRRPHVIEVAELRIEYPAAIVLSYPGNRIIVRGEVRRPLIDADAAHIEGSKRSEEHTSELQSRENLVCRLLLEKKNKLK